MSKSVNAPAGTKALDFLHPEGPNPHGGRGRAIILNHPEIRDLVGKNPVTFWITLGIVVVQTALAAALHTSPWWLIVLVAVTRRGLRQPRPLGRHPRGDPQPDLQEAGREHSGRDPREPAARGAHVGLLPALPHEASRVPRDVRLRRRHPEPLGAEALRPVRHREGPLDVLLLDHAGAAARAAAGPEADRPLGRDQRRRAGDLRRRSPLFLGSEGHGLHVHLAHVQRRPSPARRALDPGALHRVSRAGDGGLLRARSIRWP